MPWKHSRSKVDGTEQPDLDRTSLLFYYCSVSCHEKQFFVQVCI